MIPPVFRVEDLVPQTVEAQWAWEVTQSMLRKEKAIGLSLYPQELFLVVPGGRPQRPPMQAPWPGAAGGGCGAVVLAWPCHSFCDQEGVRWAFVLGLSLALITTVEKETGVKCSFLATLIYTAQTGSKSKILFIFLFILSPHF